MDNGMNDDSKDHVARQEDYEQDVNDSKTPKANLRQERINETRPGLVGFKDFQSLQSLNTI